MNFKPKSIRTFIGSKNFKESRSFYHELGFKEIEINPQMSHFYMIDSIGFYLQNHYVKEWVENSMVFLEVENLSEIHQDFQGKQLDEKFPSIKLSDIKHEDWADTFHLIDPAGVLWHIAEMKNRNA